VLYQNIFVILWHKMIAQYHLSIIGGTFILNLRQPYSSVSKKATPAQSMAHPQNPVSMAFLLTRLYKPCLHALRHVFRLKNFSRVTS
jgi:hypothetical protein